MSGGLPNAVHAYILSASVVLGAGAFALAADLYARRSRVRRLPILDVYSMVLGVSVFLGLAALGRGVLVTTWSWWLLIAAIPIGAVVGHLARQVDRRIVRAAARSKVRWFARPSRPQAPTAMRTARFTATKSPLLLGGSNRRPPHRGADVSGAVDPREFPLRTVITVAIAEELFFRGVLLQAALLAGWWAGPLLVVGTVLLFSLGHLAFGWAHVIAKAPLGALTASAVLLLGSIVPALVAHVWFNLSVWRDIRATGGIDVPR